MISVSKPLLRRENKDSLGDTAALTADEREKNSVLMNRCYGFVAVKEG